MTTWRSDDAPPQVARPGAAGMFRAVLRGGALVLTIVLGLVALLALRLIERPVFGRHRPMTPYITQFVCRAALWIMGIRFRSVGVPLQGQGAVVANHSSWLDIFALNATQRVYFVSKEEVSAWPGIGWLARATGTVFIRRDRRAAAAQVDLLQSRLVQGHRLLFFPEGTSTDGRRVLPFKPTLFGAFMAPALRDALMIQPVTVIHTAPPGADPRFYGWWGDMDLGPHLLAMLAARRHGQITVVLHPAVSVADFADRKELARALESAVRAGLSGEQAGQP